MEDVFGLVGQMLESKYAVEAVVAAGGFGVVYRGRHVVLGAPVAVKVLKIPETLPARMHGGFVRQFVEEARIISQLSHPCIVRVTDFGVLAMADGQQAPWMVLEWIEGETLAKHLEARRGAGGRSPREALALMRPVLEALCLAHERGIVHRDLKPGNLMMPRVDLGSTAATGPRLSGRPLAPTLRLLDFGLAKTVDESDGPASGQTRTTSALQAFSPRYASPEQSSGTRTGPWTDVHALGLILTELLVDASPYRASDKMELQIQVLSSERPTPARFGVDVGPWEPVLRKALALRPTDRYASAGELLDALEASVPERATSAPATPLEAPAAPLSGVRSEPVHTTTSPAVAASATTGPAAPPAPPRSARTMLAAGGLVLLGAAVAVAALRVSSPSPSPAATSSPPRAAAQPAPTQAAPAPAAPAPAAPAAPVADAATQAQADAAPADEAPAAAEATREAPARGARHGRRRRANDRIRPWEQ